MGIGPTIVSHQPVPSCSWIRQVTRVIPRLLWVALAVLHMPILAGAMASLAVGEAGVGATLTLLGSLSFFVLKILDVPWLRLRSRAAGLALLVVVGLIHAEVIADASQDPVAWQAPAVVATTGAVAGLLIRRRSGWPVTTGIWQLRLRLDRVTWAIVRAVVHRRPAIALARVAATPRAPPA